MARRAVHTTLDKLLYDQIQLIALQQSAARGEKVNANDMLEEGMRLVIEKYGTNKGGSQSEDKQ